MTRYSARGLHGQVVHELGARILSGRILPGTTIDLSSVESELGISRTVLRESLKVLAAKGLVGARQKRGTFVTAPEEWNMLDADVLRWRVAAQPTQALLDQLAEVRRIVEPAAAALAAARRGDADLDALEQALAGMDAAVHDPADVVQADLRFHTALLEATHNVLIASLKGVIEQGLRQRDLLVHANPGAADPLPSHRAVLAAVRARDEPVAERAMRALLEQAAADFAQLNL
ncbi:FadR/GntR family transcriptional regulator [Rugosimonospora africana]|uniref:GntR family transcriptional regulator n=1 Tax=Rugosimonospora africana TaxID=556532 RepID=A0A8J3QRD9_9ACTN|nr:FadR/GntR family transcriptional regulator [Rugosimonospora africana]GIH15151.1 GntR family transcriptional regulator [Rugosimonospora africana]